MLMPSKISLIKYKQNYVGYLNNNIDQKSVVFGFIKQEHVKKIKNFLKYEVKINKSNDNLYSISNNIKLRKPINRKELLIKNYEPIEAYVHMELNNIELRLIDDIKIENEYKILLISNFDVNNIEIDDNLRLESLNANIEGNYFISLDHD
jgi:hypothetical protein